MSGTTSETSNGKPIESLKPDSHSGSSAGKWIIGTHIGNELHTSAVVSGGGELIEFVGHGKWAGDSRMVYETEDICAVMQHVDENGKLGPVVIITQERIDNKEEHPEIATPLNVVIAALTMAHGRRTPKKITNLSDALNENAARARIKQIRRSVNPETSLHAAAPDLLRACKISGVGSFSSHGLLSNVSGILSDLAQNERARTHVSLDEGQINTLEYYAKMLKLKADAEYAAIEKAEGRARNSIKPENVCGD